MTRSIVVRGATTSVQVGTFDSVIMPAADTEALVVAAGLGDDVINVSGSGGPASLTIDGGLPTASDTLNVTTGTNAIVSVTFGTDPSTGVVDDNVSGNVSFQGIEVLGLTGSGAATSLTVNGTNGDDAINQNGNSVTVNNGAVVNFSGYPTLTLTANNGDDTFNVYPTTLPVSVTTFNVNGGDPTASDTLIVNGTAGNDTIEYNPTDIGTGTVTVNALTAVSFDTIEALYIDGQGGTDALRLRTLPGSDQVTYTPGAAADAGTIATRGALSGITYVPLTFTHIGAFGSVSFASGTLGVREDTPGTERH